MSLDSFLTEAALVVPQSTSTSSHLLATHSRRLHESSKSLNIRQQRDYCGACGSIRKPEWTKITEIKPKINKALPTSASRRAAVYKCLRCRRRTVLPSQQDTAPKASLRTAPITTSSIQDANQGADQGQPSISTDPKSSGNQNSKKRAKTRKQGGLQAMLASKQQAQPSLDLLDFLQ